MGAVEADVAGGGDASTVMTGSTFAPAEVCACTSGTTVNSPTKAVSANSNSRSHKLSRTPQSRVAALLSCSDPTNLKSEIKAYSLRTDPERDASNRHAAAQPGMMLIPVARCRNHRKPMTTMIAEPAGRATRV